MDSQSRLSECMCMCDLAGGEARTTVAFLWFQKTRGPPVQRLQQGYQLSSAVCFSSLNPPPKQETVKQGTTGRPRTCCWLEGQKKEHKTATYTSEVRPCLLACRPFSFSCPCIFSTGKESSYCWEPDRYQVVFPSSGEILVEKPDSGHLPKQTDVTNSRGWQVSGP